MTWLSISMGIISQSQSIRHLTGITRGSTCEWRLDPANVACSYSSVTFFCFSFINVMTTQQSLKSEPFWGCLGKTNLLSEVSRWASMFSTLFFFYNSKNLIMVKNIRAMVLKGCAVWRQHTADGCLVLRNVSMIPCPWETFMVDKSSITHWFLNEATV